MGIIFKFLKAGNGDSILISTNRSNILIDGGTKRTFNIYLKKEIDRLREANQIVDLMVLTHIDSDHIDGLVKLLENEKMLLEEKEINYPIVKSIWFNAFENKIFSDETSFSGYKTFREFIAYFDNFISYNDNLSINNEIFFTINSDIDIVLLSPNNQKLKKLHKKYKDKIEEDFFTSQEER